MKHFGIWEKECIDNKLEYKVHLGHPRRHNTTLCGISFDQDSEEITETATETEEKITCKFCLETIKIIKEYKNE